MSAPDVIAAVLYAAGLVVGAWGGARLWRAARMMVSRSLPTGTGRVQLLGRAATGGALGAAGAAMLLAGLHIRGELFHADALPREPEALVAGVVLLVLALGAVVAGWWYRRDGGRRRSYLLLLSGLALLMGAYLVTVAPRVQRQGLRAGVPTLALILAWPWLPEGAMYELDGGPSSRRLAAWQRAILRWRSAGVIADSSEREMVRRAARLYPAGADDHPTASPTLLRDAFGAYCSEDRAASDAAADFLFVSLTTQFLPSRFDDETARHLLPIVERGIESADPTIAQRSLWTVERLGTHADRLVPALEKLIGRAGPDGAAPPSARAGVSAIAALAQRNEDAWRVLAGAVKSGSDGVQVAAVQEMKHAAFAARGAEIAAAALALVETGSDDAAAAATSTYIFMAPNGCAGAPAILSRAARTEEVGIRAVRHLVTECESPEAHGLLDRLLRSEDERAAWHALTACAALGGKAERHRARIEALTTDSSARVASAAREALAGLRPK